MSRRPVGLRIIMQSYSETDIAGDPDSDGGTSAQILWISVPVLIMESGQRAFRIAASFMTSAGLPDWMPGHDADYVATTANTISSLPSVGKFHHLLDHPTYGHLQNGGHGLQQKFDTMAQIMPWSSNREVVLEYK